MLEILIEYPLLLLFVVASLGYLIGNIKIKGSGLGVAAILFTGLAIGALDPRLHIPDIIFLLGLSMFVYSLGLSSGPAFFESYRKNGISEFIFIILMLLFSGLVACALWFLMGFSAATITGIYSGSTTNTAALAGVIDYINNNYSAEEAAVLTQEAVVGYSFSYPMGVLGGIILIVLMERIYKINFEEERKALKKVYSLSENLTSATIKIKNEEIAGIKLRDLLKEYELNVNFGRIFQNNESSLTKYDTVFDIGDIVMVVGELEDVNKVVELLGEHHDSTLMYDRQHFDVRRIFVSNSMLVGRTIASLNIHEKFDAVITRIRRGDNDMLATPDTVLELGDRIRFIARREDLNELSKFFGDSYRESSRVNLFSFGLGIGIGLILGTIKFSLGSDIQFSLGYAGGPLIVGLVLGALRRTGPIVWTLPYSANVTLQQIGLIFLLAAIGVRSGSAFVNSLSIEGIWIFLAGTVISLLSAFIIFFVGYKINKKPFSLLMGMVANQPAILDFAVSRTNNRIPVLGYTLMFPIALISKILIAQLMFLFLS